MHHLGSLEGFESRAVGNAMLMGAQSSAGNPAFLTQNSPNEDRGVKDKGRHPPGCRAGRVEA